MEKVVKGAMLQGHFFLTPESKLVAAREDAFAEKLHQMEKREAFLAGKEQGEKIGYEKAWQEAEAFFQLLQSIALKVLEQKKRLVDNLKPELVEFSLLVIEKVIRQELSQPEKLARMIDSLLSIAAPSLEEESVKISLASEDLKMLESYLERWNGQQKKSLQFACDPFMQRGDCKIETKAALLNYSLTRELEELHSKVLRGE